MRAVLCIGLALLAVVVVARPAHHHHNVFEMDHTTGSDYTFEKYVSHFNKKYERHAHEFHRKVFAENFEKIKAHNSDKTQTYKKAVNRFTDMTEAQRSAFLGSAVQSPSHLLGMARTHVELPHTDMSALPASVDWRTVTPSVITPVKDQLSCGSCWAHGATEQVETYTAMATGTLLKLSRQELVDCAPNPDDCGGTGGCGGSTAELGFQYVSQAGGMATEAAYPYKGINQPCNAKNVKNSATVGGWNVLPANNYTAVMQAVATIGPLAINVDASNWFDYSSGVYTGCSFSNIDIDHVVQLVGYGHDTPSGLDYWIVRNSWNTGYGEAGYIRVQRHSAGTNEFCGPDTKPSDGTGCNGGPAEVEVCGSCGLWYDTSYPTGAALVQ